MSAPRDPFLDLPLEGVQLVEASAGTGKTYTLATLVTRLVVERGLRIGQILAVTYTEAATQELRKRIRERLQLALVLIDAPPTDGEAPEAMATRAVLANHRAACHETDDAVRRRLRQAVLEVDLAAIHTIHGFCARVLREHALESGHVFAAPDLLGNDRDLRAELAADLWRNHARDGEGAADLAALWPQGPAALAQDLRDLLGDMPLWPEAASLSDDPMPRVREAGQALADSFRADGTDFLEALRRALTDKVLNGRSYTLAWIEPLWEAWSRWCDACDFSAPPDDRIDRLVSAAMLEKANKGKQAQVPQSPLCDAIAAYLEAVAEREAYVVQRRINRLHLIRDEARQRLAQLKRQRRVQTYDDLIDGVAHALAGSHGDALAARLREQYAVALVDEFQDTDGRQWAIFDRVFGRGSDAPALFLIGDPKQAIYGFRGGDVHAYLAAAGHAEAAPPLSANFRSRPAMLQAIETLYTNAGGLVSIDPEIPFRQVHAGGKRQDGDYLRAGQPAAALTVWQAPEPPTDGKGKRKPWSAPRSRELATEACVAAIHAVLSDAHAGNATIDGEPVQPGDIAVLVRTHYEATLIQQALALAGIPAVAAGKLSLFATPEARDLHALLLALLHGGDDGRLRATLASVLVGVDAVGIDALEADGAAHRQWQLQAQAWRDRLSRGGPLALVGDLVAAQAERLLGLLDGERRVSNYLQLAEVLQEAQDHALGLQGLVDWLAGQVANADPDDEAQLLRLESDARRVQIVTLHKSKGLEYPLVFLPFVGIGGKARSPGRVCVAHGGAGRQLHWRVPGDADWALASASWTREQQAEDARLLYVAMTRAEHALWIATGAFYGSDKASLTRMLSDTETLRAAGVVFGEGVPAALPRLDLSGDAPPAAARIARRLLASDWWVHSFSQLARADSGDTSAAATLPVEGGKDEPEAAATTADEGDFDARFAGNRYGVALHAALENADFAAWRDWADGDPAPAGEREVIAAALRGQGYADALVDDGIAHATRLVGHTLTVPLPEGTRLCDVPARARRAEIEFQFALQPTRVEALLQLLHAHGVAGTRDRFGLRRQLEGLMTGLVDLTYRHDGRWYVLDYKSNRLPGYDAAALDAAMAHSEYDLQALIYTLALHRWLRFRLGASYDYARDFGGIRYLFCRGLDAARNDSPGIHAMRFAPELVHALDALFGHAAEGAAA